ncbi:MAG: SDR family oxidoreductase [Verrucomicrobia bacterium]|nr:MAG: SDR family oxidoreductase [Verrucomicrobiota bacterium]
MGKKILCIGGNRGIGYASIKALLEEGHEVISAARTSGPLADLGIQVQPFDAENNRPLELPPVLDGMVYFPGSITLKPFHRISEEDFLHDFRVNCLGAAMALQAALPALKAAPRASVILFSTVACAQGMAMHASISAAKGALEGMALALSAELAPKIQIHVIAPSLTDTPLAQMLLNTDAKREAAAKRHPLQQIGKPEDIAKLVLFLLGDHAQFFTGQIFRPDGGLSSVRTF